MTSEVLKRLLKEGFNADVWLSVKGDERKLPAHRFILTARSEYFKTLLSVKPEKSTVCVKSSLSISFEMLEKLIYFLYTSDFKGKLSYEEFKEFYAALKCFNVNHIEWEEVKEQVLNVWKVDTVLEIHSLVRNDPWAKEYNLPKEMLEWTAENFDEVVKDSSYLATPLHTVEEILSSTNLKIDSEEGVFRAIVKWINNNYAERSQYFPRLLKCVRYDANEDEVYQVTIDFVVTEMLKWCSCRESKLYVIHLLALMDDPEFKIEGCQVENAERIYISD